jgi:hypothetical protein
MEKEHIPASEKRVWSQSEAMWIGLKNAFFTGTCENAGMTDRKQGEIVTANRCEIVCIHLGLTLSRQIAGLFPSPFLQLIRPAAKSVKSAFTPAEVALES